MGERAMARWVPMPAAAAEEACHRRARGQHRRNDSNTMRACNAMTSPTTCRLN